MALLRFDKIDEMQQLVKQEKYENPYFSSNFQNDQLAYFNVLEAIMGLKKNQNEMAFNLLKEAQLAKYPCNELFLMHFLERKEFYPLMNERFSAIERSGFHNFTLYNNWGSLLIDLGKFKEAYDKFKVALSYPGDEEWALLNWGNAAFIAHDYELAVKKYNESLAKGLVPRAVFGLLKSLMLSNNSKQYLAEYKRYFKVLSETLNGIDDENLKIVFSKVAYAFHCQLSDKSELEFLVGKAKLELNNFDPKLCDWTQNESNKNTTPIPLH